MPQQTNKRIAILNPSKGAYSESFILAHKKLLKGKVFYYFSGLIPSELEGHGPLINLLIKVRFNILKSLKLYKGSLQQYALIISLKKNKIELVLAEYGYTGAENFQVCKDCKIPLIVHFHGSDSSHQHNLQYYKNSYLDMFTYASKVIAVSYKMVEQLKGLGCDPGKIINNPCGPSASFLDIQPDFKSQNILFVGRFVDKKAPYYLIFVLHEVLKFYPKVNLRLIGDGQLMGACLGIVKYLKLEDSVHFLGSLPHESVVDEMKSAFVYIQHSVTSLEGETEGTPVSVLEAQAAGLPVVATNHAGIGDVVKHNETGLLVEEHDILGMAENVKKLLESPELAKKFGENGRNRIMQNYSLEKHIGILNDIIEKTIS